MSGPNKRTTVTISCGDCPRLKSEKWSIEDGNDYDWGFDHHCGMRGGALVDAFQLRAEDCPILTPHNQLHQPPRDLSRVAVRTCPISGLESHR